MAETIQWGIAPIWNHLYTLYIRFMSPALYRFGAVSVKGSIVHQEPQWTRNHSNFVFLICKHWRFYLINNLLLSILEFRGGFLRITALQAVRSGLG